MDFDAIDVVGAAGQGNTDPIAEFSNHFVVRWSGSTCDPSYGTGPFPSAAAHEADSFDGFERATDNRAMKNPITDECTYE